MSEPLTLGVVGSRRRTAKADKTNLFDLLDTVRRLRPWLRIVSGACDRAKVAHGLAKPSADLWAAEYAALNHLELVEHEPVFPVDYREQVAKEPWKAAKPYWDRNDLIAQDADVLIGLVAGDRKGGTENTIKTAKKLAKVVWVHDAADGMLGWYYLPPRKHPEDLGRTAMIHLLCGIPKGVR